MVVLPAEPRGREDDPLICGTCGAEVPDHRLQLIADAAEAEAAAAALAEEQAKPENRVYTRKGLLQGLRDAAADRAAAAARDFAERARFPE